MNNKKVKIIATLGPVSESSDMILKLAKEGVDVFRINLSHSSEEWVKSTVQKIRSVEQKLRKPLAIMGDLAGPKIRIGKVKEGTFLKEGDKIQFVSQNVLGDHVVLSVNYPSVIKYIENGAEIYLDDGKIRLTALKKTPKGLLAVVRVGGELKSHKGFYAEGISLVTKGLSPKDKKDIELMVKEDVDALAVSFVQSQKDIQAVKKLIPASSQIMLIAKIETARSIEDIEQIIAISDGVMVARGDLGLAVPIAEVPHLQKKLISLCLRHAKPVITATQMLESMHYSPIPTRAEVTDVANAILDGTDCVMLSGETAMGNFPLEAVSMMGKIITRAIPHVVMRTFHDEKEIPHAIGSAVGEVADQIDAKLILAFTEKGEAARRISRHRHPETILALSPNSKTVRQLNFSWGVIPLKIEPTGSFDNMLKQAKHFAVSNSIHTLKKHEPFVIVAGMPFGESGTTNMILVEKV